MQKHLNIPILQLSTLFVFVFKYSTLFEYIQIVSVFTNSIRYLYSFQNAKRILFGIRSKITIRPNTGPKILLNKRVFQTFNFSYVLLVLEKIWPEQTEQQICIQFQNNEKVSVTIQYQNQQMEIMNNKILTIQHVDLGIFGI